MSRRLFGFGAGAVLLAGATWVACGNESETTPSTGGADAGGGASGTGGPLWGGGGTTSGGGGSSASGGAAGDGGIDWGADPKWESTGQVAAGCPIERLANPKEVTAFVWKACSWSNNCEEAEFNAKVVGSPPAFSGALHDDGSSTRLTLTSLSTVVTVVADATGNALDAFKGSEGPEKCILWSSSIWADRVAVMVAPSGFSLIGGVLATVGSASLNAFTLTNPPPGGPQRYPLGEKRWLWWWAPVARFSTVSAVDGSDFTIFAKEGSGQTALLSGPNSAGAIFLFDEWVYNDAGSAQRRISWSDGKLPAAAYLTSPAWTDDFGAPAFANSHVGFLRGINRKNINQYDSVELWASPFSASPGELQPELVEKLAFTGMPDLVGGHGVLSTATAIEPGVNFTFTAWKLATKGTRSFTLPGDHVFKAFLGISRDHVYIAAAKPNTGPSAYLVRYPVP